MAQTHHQPEWSPVEATDTPPREKNASLLLLWVIALIAVVAAGLAWYKQRQPATLPLESAAPPVTAPATTTPDERVPATTARADQPGADARRTSASAERQPRSQAPRLLAGNPSPQYPAAALRAGVGGTVMVRAELDANGQPVDVDVIRRSGNRDLDRAAVQAVRKWRFEPAMRNGKGVASTVQVPVDFKPI